MNCIADNCAEQARSRDLCNRHYQRWYKLGDPNAGGPPVPRGTPSERFWPKVNRDGPVPEFNPDLGQCWIWTGYCEPGDKPYGRFRAEGRGPMLLAHRFAYADVIRPLLKNEQLDHLCRNQSCVRPSHLDPVSNRENVRRGLTSALREHRTHCPSGHLLDEQGVAFNGRCHQCSREKIAARRGGGHRRDAGSRPERLPLPKDRTHCPQGHPYDEINTYVSPKGGRSCRICTREAMRRHRARRLDST